MRHALIHKKAEFIDQLIDYYKRDRRRKTFPHKIMTDIILVLFPASKVSGRGWFKQVYRVSSRSRHLVLKTASRRSIMMDMRAYNRLPKNIRNRYFAKIYWRTKYCLLQKYGKEGRVPDKKLETLKAIGREYGLSDIRAANIRKIDGRFKIVDANPRKR